MATPRLQRTYTTDRLKQAYWNCLDDKQAAHILRQLEIMQKVVAIGGLE